MRGAGILLLGVAAAWPTVGVAQGAGYGPRGLERNIPQERAREAYKVEKAREQRKLELLREQGHPRHEQPPGREKRQDAGDRRNRRR